MTFTAITGPGRVSQFVWGDRLQNTLFFTYPTTLDSVSFWRAPEMGSEHSQINDGQDAWVVARDYFAALQIRWLLPQQWSQVQRFLDWASTGNAFSVVPDAVNAPQFAVPGCLLVSPFDRVDPKLETNSLQVIDIVIRNPAQDIGLAWRGLVFEYAPGASLTDPAATFTRASIAARHTADGKVDFAAIDVLRDNHYIGTVRQALFERASVNSALWSEAFDTATSGTTWQKSSTTVTADAIASPRSDAAVTADLLLETAVNATHYLYQTAIGPITSGEAVAASIYIKAGPRFRGRLYAGDIAGTNWFGVDFNISTGTLGAITNAGAGVGYYKNIVALANGWFRIEIAGNINGGVTSGHMQVNIYDDTGAGSYLGDVTKGLYVWGAQFERWGVTLKLPATSYIKTVGGTASRSTDSGLAYAWPYKPQAGWFYAKFTELGTLKNGVNANGGWFQVGTGSSRSVFFVQETPGSQSYSFYHRGEVDRNVAFAAGAVNTGDTVELLGILFPDGSIDFWVSVNGAADVHSGQTTAFQGGLAFAWSSAFITLGTWSGVVQDGRTGIQLFRAGTGTSVNTIAKARAA